MKLTLSKNHVLPAGALGLAISADGSLACVACADGAVLNVEPGSGKMEPYQAKHSSFASGAVLLPDGRTLITAGYDGALLWHDTATRKCWRRVQAHGFWSWQLALSADGRRVASVSGQYLSGGWKYEPAPAVEPAVKVYDSLSGDLIAALDHTPPVLSCAFTPDGRHLAAANMMGGVRIWDLENCQDGKPVSEWTTPEFTSWGSIKTHHYCGGIYGLSFSPDGKTLLCCGMGPMTDPMAGNGRMTWQRWTWQTRERVDQIKDGQHGSGLMESVAWHPDGTHFIMAGRQAQGTWNAALFSAADGVLVHSIDTKKRITQARFTGDGKTLFIAGANGQPSPRAGIWPPWGRLQTWRVEA